MSSAPAVPTDDAGNPLAHYAGRARWEARALAAGGELPLVFVACFVFLLLRRNQFAFWEDEGINLIKAMMVSEGFSLYRDIYSDHVPLFTWLLVPFHRWFGGDHAAMAQVGIAFGALAMAAAYAIARTIGGRGAALCSLVVLSLLAPVQKFGSAIIIPMPALALASWAVFCALQARDRAAGWWPAASGALLALAVCIKLSFVYFLPILGLALALNTKGGQRWRALAVCAGTLVVVGASVLALADVKAMLPQVLADHLKGLDVFRQHTRAARITLLLAPGLPLLYASAVVLGAFQLVRGLRPSWVLVSWVAIVGVWIALHRPLWAHHLPELLLPLSILLGCGVTRLGREALQMRRQHRMGAAVRLLPLAAVVLGLSLHVHSYGRWRWLLDNVPLSSLEQLAQVIRQTTGPDDWILPDRPILGYLAGRKVPPPVAMISEKRIRTGELTDDQLLQALDRYQPVAVTVTGTRFLRFPELQRRIGAEYRRESVLVTTGQFSGREVELHLFKRKESRVP